MRNTVTVSLLALTRLVVAICDTASPCQPSADAVPVCAKPCIASAAVTHASCSTPDYKCQCDKLAIIQSAAVGCVVGGCGLGGALNVLASVGALCSCVTAHPTIPCAALATITSADPVTGPAPTTTSPATITELHQLTPRTGPITTGPPPGSCDSASPCQPSADAVPNCAKPCIESAAVSQASCSTADYQCQCDKQDIIQGAAVGCVVGGCGFDTALQVLGSVSALCGCVTAHPTTPCASAPATSTASPITTTEEAPETTTTCSTLSSVQTSTWTSTTGPVTTGSSTCDPVSPCQPSAEAVPKCAQSCISSAAEGVHCAAADFECQCSKAGDIQNGASNCVIGGCDFETALQVVTAVGSLCDCVAEHPTTSCASVSATTTSPGTTEKPAITTASSSSTGPITSEPSSCGATSPCQPSADAIAGCAKPCIESAAVTQASCAAADYQCQCSNQGVIQDAAVGCVVGACGLDTALQVLPSVGALCECVTAHPTTPCTSGYATSTSAPQTTNQSEASPSQPGTTTKPDAVSEPSTTCKPGSTTDCGPVASTAVPSCAQACFSSAAPKISCKVNDYGCQCNPDAQASLTKLLVPCVVTACPPASLPAVIAGASSVCACASAPPSPGDCSTTGPGRSQTVTSNRATATTFEQVPSSSSTCEEASGSSSSPSTRTGGAETGGPTHTDGNGGQPTGGNGQPSGGNGENTSGGSGGQPTGGNGGQPSSSNGGRPSDGNEQSTGGNGQATSGHGGEPSGGNSGQSSGGSGGQPTPTGGNGGIPGGTCEIVTVSDDGNVETSTTCYATSGPTGGNVGGGGNGGGSGGEPTSPAVVAPAARFEMSLVGGIFGAFWLIAVAL